jgi:hypothetical protein
VHQLVKLNNFFLLKKKISFITIVSGATWQLFYYRLKKKIAQPTYQELNLEHIQQSTFVDYTKNRSFAEVI